MNIENFLAAHYQEIQPLAPETLILGAGGTRRQAELAGISNQSTEYALHARNEMIACVTMVFRHGVRHVIAPLLIEGSQREITADYRDKLVDWLYWGLGGDDAAVAFSEKQWRVRLLGSESWPEVADLSEKLRLDTSLHSGPTVWFSVMSQPELHWEYVLRTVAEQQAFTQEAAIRAVYGEDIPPATLYLGSGKPDVVASAVPPLLIGSMQCYWRQHLGYDLDQESFRRVLYDYAFTRRTWRKNKTGRAEQAKQFRSAWEAPPIIGLGFQLGPFWYPAPFSLPPEIAEEETKWISRP